MKKLAIMLALKTLAVSPALAQKIQKPATADQANVAQVPPHEG
jgi:hypothetical protein